MQEFARTDLNLSDMQMGLVQGMATAIPAALLSIPIGWMADHSNRVRIMLVLAVLLIYLFPQIVLWLPGLM